ncbi:MAG: CaiB/BaiF CoA transferase family protein [Haloferacaceae archaeon]
MSGPDAAPPLAGTTVVELGHIIAAPFAGVVLADLGADVVKVERPGAGDVVRSLGDSGRAILDAFNRNKRSVALDLKSEGGREAYRDLAAEADVVVENLGPDAADRLGVGYGTLAERNPGLVYCSIKGFFEGPYGDRPGMDMVAEAMSGLSAMTGDADDRPLRAGTSVADVGAAMYGVIGTVLALRERDRTGRGQRVDASLFGSMAHWTGYWTAYADLTGDDHPPLGSSHPAFALYDVFRTADDEWVFVGVTTERHWPAFCRAVGREEWLADERFETAAKRHEHADELVGMARDVLRERSRSDLVAALLDEDVPAAPVNRPSDLVDDPHLRETGLLAAVEGAGGERVRTTTTPIRGERMTTSQRRRPPALGEHTREVLSELGYDAAAVEALCESGAVDDGAEGDADDGAGEG